MTDRTRNKKTDSQNYGETLTRLLCTFLFFFFNSPVVMPAGSPGLSGESGLRRVGRETEGWGDQSRRSHCRHQVAPLAYRAVAKSAVPCRADLLSSTAAFWQGRSVRLPGSLSCRASHTEVSLVKLLARIRVYQTGFTPDVSEIIAAFSRR